MAASNRTVQEVARIIRKHVDPSVIKWIIRDLKNVDGNKSFRDTIEALANELSSEQK